MRTKNAYKINIISARRSISPSMSSQRATSSRQNYHCRSATPPRQNYHRHSITPPRHSHQINRNYRDIESHCHRSISPNEHSHYCHWSRSPDEKDKEYVDVDNTETTGVMGTTGLSCPMDNLGFCDLDADETTVAPCDANETTISSCDNTNSAIATFSVNPSNKRANKAKIIIFLQII
ncbi:hypothetical protein C2G38_2298250 [Gigaspora rosea]|uniref:Uncharacterized protein n=1 Tax=Gigaspora rosea TaxID=44941 RepID=A0A397VRR7_9GLOM|nr:hypothetical protein C2G38_2298250 [Gigaspora rosea]